jgi:hypothetical protein
MGLPVLSREADTESGLGPRGLAGVGLPGRTSLQFIAFCCLPSPYHGVDVLRQRAGSVCPMAKLTTGSGCQVASIVESLSLRFARRTSGQISGRSGGCTGVIRYHIIAIQMTWRGNGSLLGPGATLARSWDRDCVDARSEFREFLTRGLGGDHRS